MKSIEVLLEEYPEIKIVEVEQRLDQDIFDAQKTKHQASHAEGAAIGTAWLDDDTFVLCKRSSLHAGWALIGGTVENGEMFDEAFLREVDEETGIKAIISRVILFERKTFTSPSNESLLMDVVLFEAIALKGQKSELTNEAIKEGLIVKYFDVNNIPEEMILRDREKLQLLIDDRPT